MRPSPHVIAFVGMCLLSGCSGAQGPTCSPVKGRLTYKGKPLAEAMVVFHRIGGDVEGNQKPVASTDSSGAYTLTTFRRNDGAPPGEYAITVELRARQTVGEETVRNGPNLLPPKYAKPGTSGLKYTVVSGENLIPPFDLK
jgi:hypothetical protein